MWVSGLSSETHGQVSLSQPFWMISASRLAVPISAIWVGLFVGHRSDSWKISVRSRSLIDLPLRSCPPVGPCKWLARGASFHQSNEQWHRVGTSFLMHPSDKIDRDLHVDETAPVSVLELHTRYSVREIWIGTPFLQCTSCFCHLGEASLRRRGMRRGHHAWSFVWVALW